MKTRFLALAVLFGLSACAPNPPLQGTPQLTFSNLPPIQLNVAQVEIVDEYQPTGRAPNIEHEMPVAPANAVQRWVQDRLRPVGTTGTVRVVIHDAQALEEKLTTDSGFTGMFKSEQTSRVKMSISVSVQLLDDRQFAVADASGYASQSRTFGEGTKLNERDATLYKMVEDMMNSFNTEIDPRIRQNLHKIVIY